MTVGRPIRSVTKSVARMPITRPGSTIPYELILDSSDIGSITFGAGQQVQTQADKSGNGNDFQQLASASQPLFKFGIKNGLSSILYDGIDDRLEGTVDFQSGTAYTFFIVCNLVGSGVNGEIFDNFGAGGVRKIGIGRRNDVGPEFDIFLRDSSSNILRPRPSCHANDDCLLTLQYESGRAITGINGANYAETTGTYTAEDLSGDNLPYVGSTRFGGGGGYVLPYPGHIHEIRIVEGVISELWRSSVDAELMSKWGLW